MSVLDSDDSEIPDMGTKSNVFSLLGGVGGSNKKNKKKKKKKKEKRKEKKKRKTFRLGCNKTAVT